jgi:hypothetical protein
MRRAVRQSLSGLEFDWVALHWRRRLGRFIRRNSYGKRVKRSLARKARREPLDAD